MDAETRQRLDTATRVRDFSKANPSSDPGYVTIVTKLEGGIERVVDLSAQQRGGEIDVRKSTARRGEIRQGLHDNLLPPLVAAALSASEEVPELAKGFRLPRQGATHERTITAARAMAKEARAQEDLFRRHGMAPTLLDDLDRALKEYDQAVEQPHSGKRAHVGARADLGAVTRDLMALVTVLDGLNRYRFRDNAEQLAAWRSAKNVAGPDQKKAVKAGGAVAAGTAAGTMAMDGSTTKTA